MLHMPHVFHASWIKCFMNQIYHHTNHLNLLQVYMQLASSNTNQMFNLIHAQCTSEGSFDICATWNIQYTRIMSPLQWTTSNTHMYASYTIWILFCIMHYYHYFMHQATYTVQVIFIHALQWIHYPSYIYYTMQQMRHIEYVSMYASMHHYII